jgi:hypothetical protein
MKTYPLNNKAPCHEDVLGSGGIAAHILDLGIRCKGVVSFTLRPFYPMENCARYPLDRRLGGSQNRSGRGGDEKKSLNLPEIEPRSSNT